MIGLERPVEQDALRILTIVHQLGERSANDWYIDFEAQLQSLDHLVRHPIDLAHVVIDQFHARQPELTPQRADIAGRTRQLLARPKQPRHRTATLKPFDPGSWQRLDDPLAYLACRELLQVETLPTHAVRFRLTPRADLWLRQSVYPVDENLVASRERCALLRNVLPAALLQPPDEPALEDYLRQAGDRFNEIREEEQILPEEDLLGRLFQIAFLETL